MQQYRITKGLKFLNKNMPEHLMEVHRVEPDNNCLDVLITLIDGTGDGFIDHSWNLQHTVWGFERGEYTIYEPVSAPSGYASSSFESPVPGITIGCITPEARDLLDTIMKAWEEHYKKLKEMHKDKHEPTFYGFAYWLVRWSGLIRPASPSTSNTEEDAEVHCARCEGEGNLWADGKTHTQDYEGATILCPECGGKGSKPDSKEQQIAFAEEDLKKLLINAIESFSLYEESATGENDLGELVYKGITITEFVNRNWSKLRPSELSRGPISREDRIAFTDWVKQFFYSYIGSNKWWPMCGGKFEDRVYTTSELYELFLTETKQQ